MAEFQKFTPRTKDISLKYPWLRLFIKEPNKLINFKCINIKEQTADIFTKTLDEALFIHLRHKSNGW